MQQSLGTSRKMRLIELWEDEFDEIDQALAVGFDDNNLLLLIKPLPFAKRKIHWMRFGETISNYYILWDSSYGRKFLHLGEMLGKVIPHEQTPCDPFLGYFARVYLTDEDVFALRMITE